MQCPYCEHMDTRVIDSRPQDKKIKRRRVCNKCNKRFNTYEAVEYPDIMVQKRSGSFQPFDREKLIAGISSSLKKRPVNREQVEAIVDELESMLTNKMQTVITTNEIGNFVLERLKKIDTIAYIRFASVYQEFSDVKSFINIIGDLKKEQL